jgi:D-methionine transport system ATP-binding protein
LIEFRHVSKVFESKEGTTEALKDIQLTVKKGDIFGVIGHSGAGKSTLIRTVNLLEYPTSGDILVDGRKLTELTQKDLRLAKKNIGMIFQHFNLLNSKSVFDNVAMPLVLSNKKKKEMEERVYEILRFVGLEEKANHFPNELSGGQKQRVGIARALVTNPTILLCDEATSALDPQTTKSILNLLKKINEEFKITILLITHEMEVIKEVCNRVAVMEEGRVIEVGSVFDIFAQPRSKAARNFVKSVVRDDIPASVKNLLKQNTGDRRIVKIDFLGASSGQSVVSRTAKNFNVDINVLFANITELQGIPYGHFIVELIGRENELDRAIQFIHTQDVMVQEVMEDGSKFRTNTRSLVGNTLHG